MKFAIEYYGIEHVRYGSDYPCWMPADALEYLGQVGLSESDLEKILYSNARRILGLRDPVDTAAEKKAPMLAAV